MFRGACAAASFRFVACMKANAKTRAYWMVKQEPEAYSWDQFMADGRTGWEGVRNFQARNNLRAMRKGDLLLWYASVTTKAVLGVAELTKEAFPDATATEGDWSSVELRPVRPFARPVSLEQIKQQASLADIPLLRQSRLSVLPLTQGQYEELLRMGGL